MYRIDLVFDVFAVYPDGEGVIDWVRYANGKVIAQKGTWVERQMRHEVQSSVKKTQASD